MKVATHDLVDLYMCLIEILWSQKVPELHPFLQIHKYPYYLWQSRDGGFNLEMLEFLVFTYSQLSLFMYK